MKRANGRTKQARTFLEMTEEIKNEKETPKASPGRKKIRAVAQNVEAPPEKKIVKKTTVVRTVIAIGEDKPSVKATENLGFDPNETKEQLRRYFSLTFVAGTFIILIPLPNFLDGDSGGIRTVASALLMLAYFAIGQKYTKSANTRAVFADSMYYLGFLFTFVALVGAMMQLNELNIQAIIGKMGPALVTTVIGMAVRIYLTQFEPITSEPETEANNALGTLTANIISALKQLDATSKDSAQIIEVFQKKSTEQMNEFATKLSQIDTVRLQNEFKELAVAINSLTISGRSLTEASNRAQSTVDEARSKFHSLDSAIENTTEKLLDAELFAADIKALNENVNSSSEKISGIADRMQTNMEAAASEVGKSVAGVVTAVKNTEVVAKKLGQDLNKTVNDVVDFLNKSRK